MPVRKTSRPLLVPFVDRLEDDGEVVVDIKFDGEIVWVITDVPERGDVFPYETRDAS